MKDDQSMKLFALKLVDGMMGRFPEKNIVAFPADGFVCTQRRAAGYTLSCMRGDPIMAHDKEDLYNRIFECAVTHFKDESDVQSVMIASSVERKAKEGDKKEDGMEDAVVKVDFFY